MKILMYGWEFPPQISGGLGTACFGLTQALVSAGHEITFVLPKVDSSNNGKSHVTLVGSNEVLFEENKVHEEALTRGRFRTETINSPLSPYIGSVEYARLLGYLQKIMQVNSETACHASRLNVSGDYGPNLMAEISRYAAVAGTIARKVPHQVIHAHDWLTIPAGIEAKRISGRPLVVHIHSLEFDRCGDNINQDVYSIERRGMEQADRIISVSGFTKSKIVRHYGISPHKITVVHNGVVRKPSGSCKRIRKRIKDKIVLFLGRITFQKGPDYFVEAAARVLSVRKDVTFVMAGSGDMMHRMMERVAELKIGRHFHFPGFLRGDDVSRIYAMSDLYIMPSVSEPFGISPLEAMQHDVPVIISRQSGIAEVVGSVFKVDFWDTRQLAGKILALLKYNSLRQEIVKNASTEIDRITWENAAGRVAGVYGQLSTT